MNHPFLNEASVSDEYISTSFPLANHTAPWHPTNTQITNWILPHKTDINYDFNEYGYRGQWTNNDLDDSIWCFGDSQTLGMGLDEQDSWVSKLERITNIKTINLGIAGASNDTIARTLASAVRHGPNPRAICVLLAAPNRREIICDQGRLTMFPQAIKLLDKIDKKLFNQYLDSVDDTSNKINYSKNLMLMRSGRIKSVIVDFTVPVWPLAEQELAADGVHLGPTVQTQIAEYFKDRLKHKINL